MVAGANNGVNSACETTNRAQPRNKKENIFDADVSLTTITTHVRNPLRIFQEKEGEEYICSFQDSTGCFTGFKTKM